MKDRQQIVKIWTRPSRDGKSYVHYLLYTNLEGKRRFESLGHGDRKKAEQQRKKKEKELRMGFCPPDSMKLSEFVEDCIRRSGNQIRPSTKTEYRQAMNHFIRVIGNIDFQAVDHRHGETFRQSCLDEGNAPDTVAKKLRQLKAMFQLAVDRRQLDEHPIRSVKLPKVPKNRKIRIYSDSECEAILRAASNVQQESVLEWDLVITLALTTGMRKGELLNMVWTDIDFSEMTIRIAPKANTEETWEWLVKDTDERVLPLTEDVLQLLIALQNRRPAHYPYVLVPPRRYDRIQQIRQGKAKGRKKQWGYEDARNSVINNFTAMFDHIKKKARIQKGTFHDLRRTAITNWFYEGLEVVEVMRLAGHSKYETTLSYYLAVKDDLVDKARRVIRHRVSKEMLDKCLGGTE